MNYPLRYRTIIDRVNIQRIAERANRGSTKTNQEVGRTRDKQRERYDDERERKGGVRRGGESEEEQGKRRERGGAWKQRKKELRRDK